MRNYGDSSSLSLSLSLSLILLRLHSFILSSSLLPGACQSVLLTRLVQAFILLPLVLPDFDGSATHCPGEFPRRRDQNFTFIMDTLHEFPLLKCNAGPWALFTPGS